MNCRVYLFNKINIMEIKEKGCVYFFRHIGLSPIKIGYSTNNSPIDRFNQFKTYAPYGSEILGFIQTDEAKEIETKLHIKYSQKRLSGEWFEITENNVNDEINFYSNIEDIKERNNFQIAWANELNKSKDEVEKSGGVEDKLLEYINLYFEPCETTTMITTQILHHLKIITNNKYDNREIGKRLKALGIKKKVTNIGPKYYIRLKLANQTIGTYNQIKNDFLKKYKENPKINISKLAKEFNISRTCFYNWINKQ